MAESNSKPYGVVYCVEHVPSGKRYVGQTTRLLRSRWAEHQKSSYCQLLYRAIKKYGKKEFSIYVLRLADSQEQLNELEVFCIKEFDSANRAFGYNLREGGSFGKHCPESKARMSEKVRAAYASGELREKRRVQKLGSTLTELQKKALRDANLGKKASDETKAKQSAIRKALWAGESADRMRQASIAAREDENYKAIVSENTKRQWRENSEAMLENLRIARDKGAAGRAAAWADPIKRAARLAKKAATIAAKKAAQI